MATQGNIKQTPAPGWENYQPSKSMLFGACVATAIATMVIGFSWGGWVTGGTSRGMASTAADTARDELASTICVERFQGGPKFRGASGRIEGHSGELRKEDICGKRRLGDDAGTNLRHGPHCGKLRSCAELLICRRGRLRLPTGNE